MFHNSWNLFSLNQKICIFTYIHILIQNPNLVSSDKSLKKDKKSYHWKRKSHVETRFTKSISINSCGTQTSHRYLISYLILIPFWLFTVFLEMLMASTISCISRIFSEHILIKSVFVVAGWPLWPSSFKSKLPALNLLNQLMIVIIVTTFSSKSINLVYSIICTITFFKT